MQEIGRDCPRSRAPQPDSTRGSALASMQAPARTLDAGISSADCGDDEPLGEAPAASEPPLACFSLAQRQCEVLALDVSPVGREVLGTLVVDGRRYLVVSAAADHETPDLTELLTPRELEIAQLIARGWDAKAIGRRLDISFHTVRVHTGRIYAKLRIHKQSELVACVAYQWPLPRILQVNGR